MTKANDKKIMATLAELSSDTFGTDRIKREGKEIILPANMDLRTAVRHVNDYYEDQSAERVFSHVFKYAPWDGAIALQNVLLKVTGAPGINQARESFFGSTPPNTVSIETSYGVKTQVVWGDVWVPMFDTTLSMAVRKGTHGEPVFALSCEAQNRFGPALLGLFKAIELELESNSIYRGKSINGGMEFIDVSGLDKESVAYSEQTTADLNTYLWSPIRDAEAIAEAGLPTKRATLLHGPYGTGKTLAAMLTAQLANEHGWTFIYCRPEDDMYQTMGLAKQYEPAIVFFEDADERAGGGQNVSRLLDTFDGMTSKLSELQMVMTSNFPERIEKGMIRPGRLDALIAIDKPDRKAIEQMIRYTIPTEELSPTVDMDAVAAAFDGYLPAFVREAIDRSVRYAIANATSFGPRMITTTDLVQAANGLRAQFDLMNEVVEDDTPDLEVAFNKLLETKFLTSERLRDTIVDAVYDGIHS